MKIAIVGYGVEGKANYNYWNTSDNQLTIVDEREVIDALPEGAATILGHDALSKLQGFDMVVRTASLAPSKLMTDGKVWSSTNEFFEKCPAPIIGVTGTKGKGTTSSLITAILRAAGKTVHLVGNIGTAPLSVLADIRESDFVVFELSSFQLWDLQKSPHVAVMLPIEPDHLDIHTSFSEYVQAKANIARYQTEDDVIVYHANNQYSQQIAELSGASRKLQYPTESDMLDALVIPGQHNRENASAAVTAVSEYVDDPAIIRQGLASFTGLAHRLKFVAEKHGVKYYDDSIATTPGSAIAAVRSFAEPKVLILGGKDKGGDYSEIFRLCSETGTKLVLLGQNRHTLAEFAEQQSISHNVCDGDMDQAVHMAARMADGNGVVILSPAAASFDMFKNYSERGDAFVTAVNSL